MIYRATRGAQRLLTLESRQLVQAMLRRMRFCGSSILFSGPLSRRGYIRALVESSTRHPARASRRVFVHGASHEDWRIRRQHGTSVVFLLGSRVIGRAVSKYSLSRRHICGYFGIALARLNHPLQSISDHVMRSWPSTWKVMCKLEVVNKSTR
jgi:hypothetical protein